MKINDRLLSILLGVSIVVLIFVIVSNNISGTKDLSAQSLDEDSTEISDEELVETDEGKDLEKEKLKEDLEKEKLKEDLDEEEIKEQKEKKETGQIWQFGKQKKPNTTYNPGKIDKPNKPVESVVPSKPNRSNKPSKPNRSNKPSKPSKPEIPSKLETPSIKSFNNKLDNIEVEYDSIKDDVLKKLTGIITIIDSNNKKHNVGLNWEIANYSGEKAGEYEAVGRFELPKGVIQSKPSKDLSVKTTVKVNQKPMKVSIEAEKQLERNLAFIHKTIDNPKFGTIAGEWSILSLGRGGYGVDEGYYDTYYNNIVEEVNELMDKHDGKLHRIKLTEHSRLILGLTSIGYDITDVGGHDIRHALADYNTLIKQGINGPIFALIAFDSNDYNIPIRDDVEVQTTRDMLVDFIIDAEIYKGEENAGGWSLFGNNPDADITGMAIQGLTPYYNTRTDVKEAVDRGLEWLSDAQGEDGGYTSAWGSENIESASQVIVALTGLGVDPHTDPRFVKNGNSIVDNILTFALEDGGFMHIKADGNSDGGGPAGKIDGMATDQGTYALVAYNRFVKGQSHLYDMRDIKIRKK